MTDPADARGRYRFQGGRPLDPEAGAGVPNSPSELIAMQENPPAKVRSEKPERRRSPKVKPSCSAAGRWRRSTRFLAASVS